MDQKTRDELIVAALEVRKRSYAKYSGFAVGAALRTSSGRIVAGCNVENVSFGMTLCAERAAIGTAVSAGDQEFTALAVATSGGWAPCGACRQVLAEFCEDLPILLIDAENDSRVEETNLRVLLPDRFSPPPS